MANDLSWALGTIRARQADYTTAHDYYYGKHTLTFATEKFRNAFGSLLKAFADNLCATVVDTVADRLQVAGFTVDGGKAAVTTACAQIWRTNRMDRRSGELHSKVLRAGDAYLIVWPDADGLPRLYPQAGHLCAVQYDDETPGLISRGAKLWQDSLYRWRLNLYYADRIEKYATPAPAQNDSSVPSTALPTATATFMPYQPAGESWPLVNPWGQVPLFHFANNAATGSTGRSELADVIPLQDGLNKSVTDMLVAMEFVALPQRWVTGLETEIDETTGKPKAVFVPGADRIWSVAAPDAQFGQFQQADLTQFVQVQEAFRVEIARVSRTPLHYLMPTASAFPSGEAMKTAEQPLSSKVRDRQLAFGNVWEDALALALRMQSEEAGDLSCNWNDTAPRNDAEVLNAQLLKQQVGVSQKQSLLELGYSEAQIAQFAEARTARSAALGEQMLSAFERGQ